jgi:ribosomal protein S27AE
MARRQCPDCGVMTSNAGHICVEYDASHPCPKCGAPSVFVHIAAPGTGSGWSCKNNHYDGTCRELTVEDVI